MKKILLFALFLLIPSFVYADDAFYTANVSIDVTASDSSVAREKAMGEANRKALLAIAQKITNERGVAKFSSLTDEQVLNFIKETSVLFEKTSPTRYTASLQILINDDLIERYMKEQDIPFAVSENINIAVLPVFREGTGASPVLWSDENPWLKAWENKIVKKGMISLKSVPRSLESSVNASEALSLDGLVLSNVAFSLGVDDVYVLDALKTMDGVKVVVSSYKNGRISSVEAADFNDAIGKVAGAIGESVKKKNIAISSSRSEVKVVFLYNKLREWIDIQAKLKGNAYVNDIKVIELGEATMNIGESMVVFNLYFSGSIDNLGKSLELDSLELVKDVDEEYILKNKGI